MAPQPSSLPWLLLATGQARGFPEHGRDPSSPEQLQLSPAGDFPGIPYPLSLSPSSASPSLPPQSNLTFIAITSEP